MHSNYRIHALRSKTALIFFAKKSEDFSRGVKFYGAVGGLQPVAEKLYHSAFG